MNDKPVILVSSTDGAPVPSVRNAVVLERLAREHGWVARQTYACAIMPPSARASSRIVESVAVRLRHNNGLGAGKIAWAVWHRVNGGPWRFASAVGVDRGPLTLARLKTLVIA